jgi:hypothetical protein
MAEEISDDLDIDGNICKYSRIRQMPAPWIEEGHESD